MNETNPLINSIQSSRIFYRINPQKLVQYYAKNISTSNRKSVSTQTIFNKQFIISRDLRQSSVDTLTMTSEKTNEVDDVCHSLSTSNSSSLTTTLQSKNAIDNSKTSCFNINFPNEFYSEISQKSIRHENHNSYFSDYLPQSRSTHSRLYIRSIYQYMFANEISNED